MTTVRFSTLVGACLLAAALCTTSSAWAQKKYTISRAPSSSGQYLQQHAIDVEDSPGHQVRVYEIRNSYPEKDFAFAGVLVKESLVRGMSDYINYSGPFTTYTVTYYKPPDSPQLLAKNFPKTDDGRVPITQAEFLTRAWKLANAMARELGWIV